MRIHPGQMGVLTSEWEGAFTALEGLTLTTSASMGAITPTVGHADLGLLLDALGSAGDFSEPPSHFYTNNT